jgi:hypothetical protein
MYRGGRNKCVCQKKKQRKGRAKTNAKANLLLPRRVNLCARKWNISAKANMALAHRNKRSLSACRRRGGPAWSCLRRSGAKRKPNAKRSAILRGVAPVTEKRLPRDDPALQRAPSNVKPAGQHRRKPCHDARNVRQLNALHARAQRQRRKPREHESVAIRTEIDL